MTIERQESPNKLHDLQSSGICSEKIGEKGLLGNSIKATSGKNNIRIAFQNILIFPFIHSHLYTI